MSQVEGVIQKIGSKTGEGKYGPWTKFSVKINEEWYGGFENNDNKELYHSVNEGDVVKVKYVVKGDYKNIDKLKVVDKATISGTTKSTGGSSKGAVDWEKKDLRAQRGFARSQAIAVVDAMLQVEGLVPVPKGKGKAMDAVLALVDELAERYFIWEPQAPSSSTTASAEQPEEKDEQEAEAESEQDAFEDENEDW